MAYLSFNCSSVPGSGWTTKCSEDMSSFLRLTVFVCRCASFALKGERGLGGGVYCTPTGFVKICVQIQKVVLSLRFGHPIEHCNRMGRGRNEPNNKNNVVDDDDDRQFTSRLACVCMYVWSILIGRVCVCVYVDIWIIYKCGCVCVLRGLLTIVYLSLSIYSLDGFFRTIKARRTRFRQFSEAKHTLVYVYFNQLLGLQKFNKTPYFFHGSCFLMCAVCDCDVSECVEVTSCVSFRSSRLRLVCSVFSNLSVFFTLPFFLFRFR